MSKRNVFILGSRGYTKKYGGFETLVKGLINNWKDENTKFYIYELVQNKSEEKIEMVNGATCIRLYIKKNTSLTMILFDIKAMFHANNFVKKNKINNPIIYILGPRIGPLLFLYRPILKRTGFVILENPAGMEWRRSKWNWIAQQYLKISVYTMAKASDYLVCDSKGILKVYNKIIKSKRPQKAYIAYGSYPAQKLLSVMPDNVQRYFDDFNLKPNEYYLILGRFIPENNYEMMIKGFLKSNTKKQLIIICNVEKNNFYESLRKITKFDQDDRIKFVGPMYDREILNYVRQYAHAYIHGHSVGGTNPGLLEAMSATDVSLLYDCVFNREVGAEATYYFKDDDSLADLIDKYDNIYNETKYELGVKAKERMKNQYSWKKIINQYEELFCDITN